MKRVSSYRMLFFFLICLCFAFPMVNATGGHIIISGQHSRLGDTITAYTMAQWLSYKYDLSFKMVPFKGSEVFSFEDVHTFLTEEETEGRQLIELESEGDLIDYIRTEHSPALLLVTQSTVIQYPWALIEKISWPDLYTSLFYYTHEHKTVGASVKQALCLKNGIKKNFIDPGALSVAVHVRSGSGPDTESASVQYRDEWDALRRAKIRREGNPYATDLHFPLKLPSEQFYVDQINKLSCLFNELPLDLYIFTDNKEPEKLINRLKKRVTSSCVTFYLPYAQEPEAAQADAALVRSAHHASIIDDVAAMAACDCFIKAESGLAFLAQLLGNHAVTLYPQSSVMYADRDLNQVMLEVNDVSAIIHNTSKNEMHFLSCSTLDKSLKEQALRALLATIRKKNDTVIHNHTADFQHEKRLQKPSCYVTVDDDLLHKNFDEKVFTYFLAQWYSYKYSLPFMSKGHGVGDEYLQSEAQELHTIQNIKTVHVSSEEELLHSIRTASEPIACKISKETSLACPGELALNINWPQRESALYFYSRRHKVYGDAVKKLLAGWNVSRPFMLPEGIIRVAITIAQPEQRASVQYRDLWEHYLAEKSIANEQIVGLDVYQPLVYPSEQFYVDQLLKLSAYLEHKPLFCCLFTNDPEPQALLARIRQRVPLKNIFLTYYQKNLYAQKGAEASQEMRSFHELQAICECDCLIKSLSASSTTAQLLGEHKLIISPQNSHILFSEELGRCMIDVHNVSAVCYDARSKRASFHDFNDLSSTLKHDLEMLFLQDNFKNES